MQAYKHQPERERYERERYERERYERERYERERYERERYDRERERREREFQSEITHASVPGLSDAIAIIIGSGGRTVNAIGRRFGTEVNFDRQTDETVYHQGSETECRSNGD